MGEGRGDFKMLTDKPIGNRPIEKPRCRWENNIGVNLKEIAVNTKNWIDSAQGRDNYYAALKAHKT